MIEFCHRCGKNHTSGPCGFEPRFLAWLVAFEATLGGFGLWLMLLRML